MPNWLDRDGPEIVIKSSLEDELKANVQGWLV